MTPRVAFPSYTGHYNTLISCCGQLARVEDAQDCLRASNRIGPPLRRSVARQHLANFAHRDVFIEGPRESRGSGVTITLAWTADVKRNCTGCVQTARGSTLAELVEVCRHSVDAAERLGRDIGADEHQLGATLLRKPPKTVDLG